MPTGNHGLRVSIAFRLKEWHGAPRRGRRSNTPPWRLNRLSAEGVARRTSARPPTRSRVWSLNRLSAEGVARRWWSPTYQADSRSLNRLSAEGVARRIWPRRNLPPPPPRLNRLSAEGVARRRLDRVQDTPRPLRVSIAFRLKEWHGDISVYCDFFDALGLSQSPFG